MAHPVLLTAGDEQRLVRVADDVVVADMPDEEAPIGKRELELGREALGAEAHGGPAYIVMNLPSLGGTVSSGNSLNDLGWASGTSDLPGDVTQHAILWLDGRRVDLGTLGGPNSGVIWPVKNDRGVISG